MPRYPRQSFASGLLPTFCKALGFIALLSGLTWSIHRDIFETFGSAGTPLKPSNVDLFGRLASIGLATGLGGHDFIVGISMAALGAALIALGRHLRRLHIHAKREQRRLSFLHAPARRKTPRRTPRRPPKVRSRIPRVILICLAIALAGGASLPNLDSGRLAAMARRWVDLVPDGLDFADGRPLASLAGLDALPVWLAVVALGSLAAAAYRTRRKRRGGLADHIGECKYSIPGGRHPAGAWFGTGLCVALLQGSVRGRRGFQWRQQHSHADRRRVHVAGL